MRPEWTDFVAGKWDKEVNVRDFIQRNYHPYDGDGGAYELRAAYHGRTYKTCFKRKTWRLSWLYQFAGRVAYRRPYGKNARFKYYSRGGKASFPR